jgi:hypothetical protein
VARGVGSAASARWDWSRGVVRVPSIVFPAAIEVAERQAGFTDGLLWPMQRRAQDNASDCGNRLVSALRTRELNVRHTDCIAA